MLLVRSCMLSGLMCLMAQACRLGSDEWPEFQHDELRTANQRHATPLSDPSKVRTLRVLWQWHPGQVGDPDGGSIGGGFSVSPAVYHDRVYVGHLNGRMYALDTQGNFLWKYPPSGQPP